jgi:4-amino-4-deoxy-L-arabinose transferase-like glycosyltransferase
MALALLLIVAGEYTIAHSADVANRISDVLGALGSSMAAPVAGLFPRGITLGLGLLLLGALLMAHAVGFPTAPYGRGVVLRDAHPRPVGGARISLCLAAALLGIGGGLAVTRAQPGVGALILWLAAPVPAFLCALLVDRSRRTGFGNPFSGVEWAGLVVLVGLGVVVVAHDLSDFHWAGVPDESYFFEFAKAICDGRLRPFPLSENGVFGYHPVLSSYYQMLFMKLFGTDIFGWRLSSAAALAGSLPFTYLLMREVWNRRAGLIAAVLFGTAQLAIGFAHLGYNNAQVYLPVLACLGILSWSIRRRSLAGYFVAGSIAGLGFYTFYAARLAAPLAFLLLWGFGVLRRSRPEVGAFLGGMLLAALPAFAHPSEAMAHMLGQTPFGAGHADGSGLWQAAVLGKVMRQWVQSILYAQWFRCGWNFGWLPVVDPVVGASALVGLCLAFLGLTRGSRARFLLPAYLGVAFVVGAVSQYDCPPLTRLLTLAPFTAMFAAMALDRFMERTAALATPRVGWLFGSGLVIAAVVWNLAALHRSMYREHHGYGDGTTAELIRIALQLPPDCWIVYVQNNENCMYNVDQILDEYRLGERSTYIRPFSPRVEQAIGRQAPPFVVIYALDGEEERRAVEAALARRFPSAGWLDSAPGKPWNLRVSSVVNRPMPTR